MENIPVRILRRMGYKAYSQGIIDRYIRMNEAWREHLQNTRAFILRTLTGKKIGNLAVYGSGWCLDLPLEELSEMTDRIQLYDLVHPSQIIHRIQKFSNIKAIQTDLTGGAMLRAYQSVKEYKKLRQKAPPERIYSCLFRPAIIPDYSISLNILSQIGELITDYLGKNIPYDKQELHLINSHLQQSHLQLLLPGKSCLITDIREYNCDIGNQQTDTKELTDCPLPASAHTDTWKWQFDYGGFSPGKETYFEIVALEL